MTKKMEKMAMKKASITAAATENAVDTATAKENAIAKKMVTASVEMAATAANTLKSKQKLKLLKT